MASGRVWTVLNVSLVFIAVLLLLNLFGVTLPTLGRAQYYLDREQHLCAVNWGDQFNPQIDLDSCCLEARKQLHCLQESKRQDFGQLDWVCSTGTGKILKYWLNNKAYHYCQQQNFW